MTKRRESIVNVERSNRDGNEPLRDAQRQKGIIIPVANTFATGTGWSQSS
jgi:hypothetical protein